MSLRVMFTVVGLGLAAPVLGGCVGASPPGPAAFTELAGVWTAQSGNVDIAILPCGEALCGDIVKVHANVSMADSTRKASGQPPSEGMRIFSELEPAGPSRWKGKIFNRENGNMYDCILTSLNPNELEVRSYVVLESIGQTQVWKKAAPAES